MLRNSLSAPAASSRLPQRPEALALRSDSSLRSAIRNKQVPFAGSRDFVNPRRLWPQAHCSIERGHLAHRATRFTHLDRCHSRRKLDLRIAAKSDIRLADPRKLRGAPTQQVPHQYGPGGAPLKSRKLRPKRESNFARSVSAPEIAHQRNIARHYHRRSRRRC